MTYLVTGCAGFIGSHLTKRLLAEGHQVVGIDKEWDTHRIDDIRGMPGFIFHKLDITDKYNLDYKIGGYDFDAIFHLAAKTGVRDSVKEPEVYVHTNIHGTLNILGVKTKKFILASTSSVYAGEKLPFTEDMAADRPLSPYAASKRAAEMICHTHHALTGKDITVLRFFTVYGPEGRTDMAPYRIVKAVCEGEYFTVYGYGQQQRDWTYVDDIVEGIIRAEGLSGFNIVNLGRGKQASLEDVICAVEDTTGQDALIRHEEKAPGDMNETLADITRAEVLLNWTPKVGIKEGMARTVQWYLNDIRRKAA